MRTFSFSMFSALFVGLAACNGGGGAEDCSDNADNDGDAAVDCDDSECATDAACDDTNDTTDTTDTNDGPEVCDDADGNDEDGDGDANCADSDCAGISANCDEIQGFIMIIDGTTSGTTSFSGTGSAGWERYELDATSFIEPKQSDCHITFDVDGVTHGSAADCAGCDFAFEMSYSNSSEQTGVDCDSPYNDLHDPDSGDPYTLDGQSMGFGYNPAYEYNSQTFPVVMYFSTQSSEWQAATADVQRTGDQFTFGLQLSQYLYYY